MIYWYVNINDVFEVWTPSPHYLISGFLFKKIGWTQDDDSTNKREARMNAEQET